MKKLTLLISMLLIVGAASAQSQQPLKGPKAKNYKPYFDKNRTSVVMVTSDDSVEVLGPSAKNQKIWKRETEGTKLVTIGSERSLLKGPKYKNFKY